MNHKKEIKAVAYLRVSTDDQAAEDRYGLVIQEESVKAYCKSQGFILNDEDIYKDGGFSGALSVNKSPPSLSRVWAVNPSNGAVVT